MDDYGVSRVRSDGLEEAEQRLTMFQVPHRLPLGAERAHMSHTEYARRAAPALRDAFQHEQAVQDIITKQAQNRNGGEKVAAVAFGRDANAFAHRDMWGVDRVRNLDPHAGRDNQSSITFADDVSAPPSHDPSSRAYVKGQMPRAQHGRRGGAPKLIPSSAILNADVNATWTVDRDQRLTLASDPKILAKAAENAVDNARMCDENRYNSRRSALQFGNHELNPGGNRLNGDLPRGDDYGIARIRSDVVYQRPPGQVAGLLVDPDPNAPPPMMSPTKPFAGRSQKSTVSLKDDQPFEAPHRGPHAGRRSKSVVFEQQAGAAPPALPRGPGYYVGHDIIGGPTIKHNEHAGKMTSSKTMEHYLKYDPQGHAAEVHQQHQRRRGMMPNNAKLVPVVEDVVFNQHPVTRVGSQINAQPTVYSEVVEGKRSVHGGQMPVEALRAAQTHVGPRELGGPASVEHPDLPARIAAQPKFPDHKEMLSYTEHAEAQMRNMPRPSPPPPRQRSLVGETVNGGQVDPTAYSHEPAGLPKRHPGPERLKRGMGIDGAGHDHRGRQLATSLVDEVIFGRSNYQGKIALGNNGANFNIDQAGQVAHR
jgi:hypothetical protein